MYYYGPNYGYQNGYAYAYPSYNNQSYAGVWAVILIIFLILILFSGNNNSNGFGCCGGM
ncbi:MAG: hypothetical protein J1F32_00910 [Erysipelotrichales bacterium]|nr:hypothetical protein [Erysipelotrichales bacterium]